MPEPSTPDYVWVNRQKSMRAKELYDPNNTFIHIIEIHFCNVQLKSFRRNEKIVEHTALTNYDHPNHFCQSSTWDKLTPWPCPQVACLRSSRSVQYFCQYLFIQFSTRHFLYGKKITISDKLYGIPCDKWSLLKIAKTFPVPQGQTDGLELLNWDRVL